MKHTILFGLLASTCLASARIHSGTHALAFAASLISGPLAALAVPVFSPSSSLLGPRQANSTTTAASGTYTVVLGDTLNAIAAANGITTQQLEDANPDVVPNALQVGQLLNLPASASSNATSSGTKGNSTSTITTGTSSAANGTSTSGNATAATYSNSVDASGVGEGVASSSSAADAGTTQQNTTSTCGSHHHHHNSTASANAQGQNGTTNAGHHIHNGTAAGDEKKNSTSSGTGSGGCGGHHHQNGTAGQTTAVSFFIPATATASALAVALTSSAAAGNVEARALGGIAAMLHLT
jgi:LysM repeat protein